jgi:diguanylate cyclase (GGDEF)-like protein
MNNASSTADTLLPRRRLSSTSGSAAREHAGTSLRQLIDRCQRQLSLNVQRGLLVLFLILQALFFTAYLASVRVRIENDAVRILRNTALLEAQQFETSMDAMRYQMRVVGNALLLNHTVAIEDADPFLAQELKKDWLDAVIVFDAEGNFLAQGSSFPLEQGLNATTIAHATFRDRPMFKDLRRDEANERLFVWHGDGSDRYFTGFVLYRAVRDIEGNYLGGVVGHFNVTTLAKLFLKIESRGFDLGDDGAISVLDHDTGIELARVGAGAGSVRPNSAALHLMDFASDSARAHHYVSPLDGVNRLGVFLNLNERKWVLAVGLAEYDLLRGWYLQTALTATAFLIMAVLQWLLLHYAHTNFLQRERLRQEAHHDPLTGLANRRHFDEWAHGACSLARRHQQPLCVLTFDLDFFKRINDRYGHDGGDAVLARVAHTVLGLLRMSDIAARFGGEEFVVALPQTKLDVAQQVAERIRASLAGQEVVFNEHAIRFTASFGLAQVTQDELEVSEGIHAALTRADKALYRSKLEGRNRITLA